MQKRIIVIQLVFAVTASCLLAEELTYTFSLAPEEKDFLRDIYAMVGEPIQGEAKVCSDCYPLPEYRKETKDVRKFMIANFSGVHSVFLSRVETSPEEAIRGIEQLLYSKETSLIAWEVILVHAPYHLKSLTDKNKRLALIALMESMSDKVSFYDALRKDKQLSEYQGAGLVNLFGVRSQHIVMMSPSFLGNASIEVLVKFGKEEPEFFQETVLDSLVISPVSSETAQEYICDRIINANEDKARRKALACLANASHHSIRTRDLLVSILMGEQEFPSLPDFDVKNSAASILARYAGVSVIYTLKPYLHEANKEELELIAFIWSEIPLEESELHLKHLALSDIPVIRDAAKKALELHANTKE